MQSAYVILLYEIVQMDLLNMLKNIKMSQLRSQNILK